MRSGPRSTQRSTRPKRRTHDSASRAYGFRASYRDGAPQLFQRHVLTTRDRFFAPSDLFERLIRERVAIGQEPPNVVLVPLDPAADLDQPQAERSELHPGDAGVAQPTAEGTEQPIGGGEEQEAELVGAKAVAGEAVGKAASIRVLDPGLRLAQSGQAAVGG